MFSCYSFPKIFLPIFLYIYIYISYTLISCACICIKSLKGLRVAKKFIGHGVYQGTVISQELRRKSSDTMSDNDNVCLDTQCVYLVDYDDGDSAEYTLKEIKVCVIFF